MVQTNFDFIVCHVFDNVNIDLIPTGKSEFIFYISWKSNIGDVVNLVYKKKQVLTFILNVVHLCIITPWSINIFLKIVGFHVMYIFWHF
jgi:hypothetical protein